MKARSFIFAEPVTLRQTKSAGQTKIICSQPQEYVIVIQSSADIVRARQFARSLATGLGFSTADATCIASVISELSRNIIQYANHGEITIAREIQGPRLGVLICAKDNGPGIRKIQLALKPGYSTCGGLGMGLPCAQLMGDEFNIISAPGAGTQVDVRIWLR
ncbi:MAG: anti-sigma regulatory factor [Pseudohongiellaceae bacterium]